MDERPIRAEVFRPDVRPVEFTGPDSKLCIATRQAKHERWFNPLETHPNLFVDLSNLCEPHSSRIKRDDLLVFVTRYGFLHNKRLSDEFVIRERVSDWETTANDLRNALELLRLLSMPDAKEKLNTAIQLESDEALYFIDSRGDSTEIGSCKEVGFRELIGKTKSEVAMSFLCDLVTRGLEDNVAAALTYESADPKSCGLSVVTRGVSATAWMQMAFKISSASPPISCVICGKSVAAKRSTRKTCSKACRDKLYRRNRM